MPIHHMCNVNFKVYKRCKDVRVVYVIQVAIQLCLKVLEDSLAVRLRHFTIQFVTVLFKVLRVV